MMNVLEACRVIERARSDAILVATMSAMGAFDMLEAQQPRVSSVPLMGGAPGLGLGLALSRPDRKVIVVDGDASLLMQLGNLVTVAANRPANFHHFVVCNGTQFTGMSNLPVPGRESVDFCAMARAAGYRASHSFDDAQQLAASISSILAASGPQLIALQVQPDAPKFSAASPQQDWKDFHFGRMRPEAQALSEWLTRHKGERV